MKSLKFSTVLMGLALFGFAGCGSSDSTDGTPDTGVGPTLYGISPGAYCYRVTGVSAVNDGCGLNVAGMVGKALPGTYDAATGTLTLGTEGSLGGGVIAYNQGTLVRVKGTMTDETGCSWSQDDTTNVTVTAQNQFSAAVTENQDGFAPVCGLSFASCTSTWTWTFAIDGNLTAPGCGQ